MNFGILKKQIASHSKNLCIPHLSVRNTILFKIFIIACPIHFIILLSHDCAKQDVIKVIFMVNSIFAVWHIILQLK